MMRFSEPSHQKKLMMLAVATGVLSGLISSVHHWYGAIVYDSPWRAGVSYWIMGFVIIFYSLLFSYWKNLNNIIGKISIWTFLLSAVVFQAGFIMFECVYSHVLKNILFFGGINRTTLDQLFPSPAYHLPDNLLFEFTGLLQFVGFVAVWFAYQVFKGRPKE